MCRLDGRIRSKEDREKIIQKFTNNTTYSSFLLTTQVGVHMLFHQINAQSHTRVFVMDVSMFVLFVGNSKIFETSVNTCSQLIHYCPIGLSV